MTAPQRTDADREQLADVLRATLDAYLEDVDPEDADTDAMAEALMRAIERAGL